MPGVVLAMARLTSQTRGREVDRGGAPLGYAGKPLAIRSGPA